jgi:hypothetical protein
LSLTFFNGLEPSIRGSSWGILWCDETFCDMTMGDGRIARPHPLQHRRKFS